VLSLTTASSIPKISQVDVCSASRDLAGGRHESRTSAEDRAGAGGIALCGGHLSLTMTLWQRNPSLKADSADAMMLSLHFTLGIFLLLAARNPSAHRSLIAFAAWSSFGHGTAMAIMASRFRANAHAC
jgi:hypothetical protein